MVIIPWILCEIRSVSDLFCRENQNTLKVQKMFPPTVLPFVRLLMEKKNNVFFCFFTATLITRKHHYITFYVHCVLFSYILKSTFGLNKSWICSLYTFLHDLLNITLILQLQFVHGGSRPNRSDCISIQSRFHLIRLQTLGIFPILEM